jgi:hypothetical protein
MSDGAPIFYGLRAVSQLFGAAATVLGANASVHAADQQAEYLWKSADYDLLRGRLAQADIDRQAKQVLAGQKSSYAAQGVDLSSESVAQVREETFMEAQRVKNEVELDAAMSAWGKKEQAKIGQEAAKDAARAARIGAAGQIVDAGLMGGAAFA